jgi:hypothetical protein
VNIFCDGEPARLIPRDDWKQPQIGTYAPLSELMRVTRYWFEGIVDGAVKVGDEKTMSIAGKSWKTRCTQATVFADPGSPMRTIVSLEVIE